MPPGRDPLLRRRLQRPQLRVTCADPKYSIFREPRREDHTTCAAVAPDAGFTVRTYGGRPL